MAQQRDPHWLLAVGLAMGLHIAVLTSGYYLPLLWPHKPLLDQVVTVDLVSLPDPEVAPKPQAEPPPASANVVNKSPETTPPPLAQQEVALPQPEEVTPEEPEPAVAARPVSLEPRKRKIRKARDTRLEEERQQANEERLRKKLAELKRQRRLKQERLARERQRRLAEQRKREARKKREAERRRLERERQRELAEARAEEKRAREAARQGREALASQIRLNGRGVRSRSGNGRGGKKVSSVILQQYLAALYQRVHQVWILPEMRHWDPGLETVVLLTIRRDGTVVQTNIEKKSRDPFFDQFVMKTLKQAQPMPGFPKLMAQETIEVGLRFRPGQLTSM